MASLGLRMATPLKDFYITPFYDIGYSWYENDSYTNYMDAYGLHCFIIKQGIFMLSLI